MAVYYRRPRTLFDPRSSAPFRVSRSKIDLFLECPRCFYLEVRLGVPRPSIPGFALNSAVDHLFKKEFDQYREKGKPHPLMEKNGVEAIPFQHPELDAWRNNFKGVQVLYKPTNFHVFGAVDDVWVNPAGELIVVDYKATSKNAGINLDEGWGPQYKRQLEVYQWLLRGNGFDVSDIGYFVYANGRKDKPDFGNRLEFSVEVIPHKGKGSWIEETLANIHACLVSEAIPDVGESCEHCIYRELAGKELLKQKKEHEKK